MSNRSVVFRYEQHAYRRIYLDTYAYIHKYIHAQTHVRNMMQLYHIFSYQGDIAHQTTDFEMAALSRYTLWQHVQGSSCRCQSVFGVEKLLLLKCLIRSTALHSRLLLALHTVWKEVEVWIDNAKGFNAINGILVKYSLCLVPSAALQKIHC